MKETKKERKKDGQIETKKHKNEETKKIKTKKQKGMRRNAYTRSRNYAPTYTALRGRVRKEHE